MNGDGNDWAVLWIATEATLAHRRHSLDEKAEALRLLGEVWTRGYGTAVEQ